MSFKKVEQYCSYAIGYAQEGYISRAKFFLEEALQVCDSIDNDYERQRAYEVLSMSEDIVEGYKKCYKVI